MAMITSIFISNLKPYVNAEYIADVLDRRGIAKVSRIAIETEKSSYKKAWVDINEWHDTEDAYQFIKSLREKAESQVVFHSIKNADWHVEINTDLSAAKNAQTVSLFRPYHYLQPTYEDFFEITSEYDDDSEVVMELPDISQRSYLRTNEELMMLHLPRHN
jgi:hypothetical protein